MSEQDKEISTQKRQDALNRFKYLLGLTDLFRHFIDEKAQKDPEFAEIIEEADSARLKSQEDAKKSTSSSNHRQRKTEKEEDAELLMAENESLDSSEDYRVFTESPGYVHGKLRDYQVQGLNWLVSLFENSISGILADEMGLGKTLQTISFLGYLRYLRGINGPHIVIVPKSTLDNWDREFARWTPDVRTLVLQGDKELRSDLINNKLLKCEFDVLITSYEIVLREKSVLKKFAWQYIVIDEAHRIKNESSSLSQIIRVFHSRNRLLITGTPLQNNLHELWSLLNFILPDVFSDSAQFDEWFETQGGDQDVVVKQLHKVLQPFLLRRIKSDVEKSLLPKKEINVYIGMSDMQVRWYQKILERDIDAVNGVGNGGRGDKTRLLNIVMQLRKCCNHPYLFEGAEPGPPYTTDEHLVFNAGKMVILDKLLKKCRERGSRVLIFSQMSRMLDILEDYCLFRNYYYNRIDGGTAHPDRIRAIDEYNKPGSEKFIFLLTTRAGGLGINLTSADTVVLYDSDWNPQADLQAMDRAHRIGQTKQVYVYRFVTENAIEEKVLDRAAQKLRLDQLVIQQGRAKQGNNQAASKDDLINMIQYGAQDVLRRRQKEIDDKNAGKNGDDEKKGDGSSIDDDIDTILERGQQKTKQLNSRYEKLGLDDLQKFSTESNAYEWNGKDFNKINNEKQKTGFQWISLAKRERKENYSVDGYYKELWSANTAAAAKKDEEKPVIPKGPKQINIQDHQFYPQRLVDIQEKETSYYRKQIGYKVPLPAGKDEDLEERQAEQQLEQSEIDNAEPLTESEIEEKARLSQQGFSGWSRRDFNQFISFNSKFGRESINQIAAGFEDKSLKEVKDYAKVFWDRYTEIDGYDRYIAQIETGEEKSRKIRKQKDLLRRKVESYVAPMQQIQLQIPPGGHGRRIYSEEEDRYLLVQMNRFGLDADSLYDKIRDAIRNSPMFRFDWFLLSRSPIELSRRCHTLLSCVMKEMDSESGGDGSSSTVNSTRAGTPQQGVNSNGNANGKLSNGTSSRGGGSSKRKEMTPGEDDIDSDGSISISGTTKRSKSNSGSSSGTSSRSKSKGGDSSKSGPTSLLSTSTTNSRSKSGNNSKSKSTNTSGASTPTIAASSTSSGRRRTSSRASSAAV